MIPYVTVETVSDYCLVLAKSRLFLNLGGTTDCTFALSFLSLGLFILPEVLNQMMCSFKHTLSHSNNYLFQEGDQYYVSKIQ